MFTIKVSEIWDHCQNLLDDPRAVLDLVSEYDPIRTYEL